MPHQVNTPKTATQGLFSHKCISKKLKTLVLTSNMESSVDSRIGRRCTARQKFCTQAIPTAVTRNALVRNGPGSDRPFLLGSTIDDILVMTGVVEVMTYRRSQPDDKCPDHGGWCSPVDVLTTLWSYQPGRGLFSLT